MTPAGSDWHVHTVSLINACLGQIGPNFRLISLNFMGDRWKLKIVVENENEIDTQSIDEIFEDYSVDVEQSISAWKIHGNVAFSYAASLSTELEIEASTDILCPEKSDQVRWIYRRRE